MSEPLKLFVNYRRADEAHFVQHMRTHFMHRYGRENVFMDFDTIPDFALFEDFIRKKVRECDALVAVIGPQWLELMQQKEAAGEPDYVLIEIEEALKNGKVVAPICILRADIPSMDDIPESLRVIFDRNVGRLDDGRHILDNIGKIMNNLEIALGEQGTRRDAVNPVKEAETQDTFDIRTARRRFLQARKDEDLPEALVWLQRIREAGAMLPKAFNLEKYETEIQTLLKEQEEARRRLEVAEYLYGFVRDMVEFDEPMEVIWAALNNVWEVENGYDPDGYSELVDALEAVDENPDSAFHYNNLGIVYHDLKRYEDAITAYQKAIEIDPQLKQLYNNLGIIYRNLKRYEDAITAYQMAIEIDPQYKGAHYNLGIVYRRLGLYNEAIATYQKAIEIDPEYGFPYLGMASIARELGNVYELDSYVAKARTLVPIDDNYNRACLESIDGNVDAVLELLGQVNQRQLDLAITDPDFDFIRDDSRFRELVGLDPIE